MIYLNNDTIGVSILPSAGGNISGITDLRSGRNWLWQNPHIPITNCRKGMDYGLELDSGGWDEVLLSIAPDRIDIPNEGSRDVEDHGDLIRQQWAAEKITDQLGNHSCVMSVAGRTLSYDFRKVITLDRKQPRINIAYALNNRETFSWPMYWCAHILLDAVRGAQIDLPTGQQFRVDDPARSKQLVGKWPLLESPGEEAIDLSDSFSMNGKSREFSSKVFTKAPESGRIDVTIPRSNERLTIRFDRDVVPWLGLWINNRGWSGCDSEPYRNLGIEPSTAPYDSVSAAVANGEISWLGPGETRQWSVSVELGP
jgi:hypothetical protein